MADAIVSTVLEHLTSLMIGAIQEEVKLAVGVKKEVKRLRSNLQTIQAVLADAEQRQMKDAAVKDWLGKLKDVSYDMDDVLDEWNTAILKAKIQGDEYAPKPKRKVRSFICCSCFGYNEVGMRHDIAHRIKDLNERLDDIAKEKDSYHFDLGKGTQQFERFMTTSVIDITEVTGREEDSSRVRSMLLSEGSETPNLRTISIVGMGGIGKTTLAKKLFNEKEVETHFEERIWVCVSDPFDEIRIAKAILEELKKATQNLAELQTLLRNVQESLKGKRFLLVLDDVWTEDSRKWEQLRNSLVCGSPGSRVLVTTRNEKVARVMGCTKSDIFRLGQLSTEECWSIFSQIALFGRSSEESERLKDIGRKIVEKCKGLPLAAKTLGGVLRFKNSPKEWQNVLDSEAWKLEQFERDIFAPLWLSYYDLPSPLRQCFSYCAMFPKDFVFSKYALIELWMAQGYLRATLSNDVEIVGEEYFKNLAARSFFQDFEKDDDGNIVKCKMHDIVHDFAQFLTKNGCSRVEIDDTKELSMNSLAQNGRHLMIVISGGASFPDLFHNPIKLRSLIIGNNSNSDSIRAALPNLFNQLTCLRSLSLSWCDIVEIPSSISKLIHLRWLDLSHNRRLKELPESLCELFNLQTLDIDSCVRLVKLPLGMGKLVNLMHLHNSNANALLPKGIGRLSSLRTLEQYVVGRDGEVASLGDLKNLNHLHGVFCISGLGNVADVGEAKQAQLKLKKDITSLGLYFDGQDGEWRKQNDKELIEALEPSPSLEQLVVSNYKGSTLFPNWLMTSFTQLRKVRLFWCGNCEQLPPLGKLPSLNHLNMWGMEGVKKVGAEFLGIKLETQSNNKSDILHHQISSSLSSSSSVGVVAFPKLTTLKFNDMRNWEEWDDDDHDDDDGMMMRKMTNGDKEVGHTTNMNITIMPRLRSLEFWDCPKLKALPHQLLQNTTLQQLTIYGCPILKQRYDKETGQHWPIISHIPDFKIP